jgi:hypothetical protein
MDKEKTDLETAIKNSLESDSNHHIILSQKFPGTEIPDLKGSKHGSNKKIRPPTYADNFPELGSKKENEMDESMKDKLREIQKLRKLLRNKLQSLIVSEFGLDVSGPLFIILGPVGGSTQVSSSSPVFPSVVPCPK